MIINWIYLIFKLIYINKLNKYIHKSRHDFVTDLLVFFKCLQILTPKKRNFYRLCLLQRKMFYDAKFKFIPSWAYTRGYNNIQIKPQANTLPCLHQVRKYRSSFQELNTTYISRTKSEPSMCRRDRRPSIRFVVRFVGCFVSRCVARSTSFFFPQVLKSLLHCVSDFCYGKYCLITFLKIKFTD